MSVIKGVQYNFRGLFLSFKTPSLLFLGLLRFFVILMVTLVLSGMVLLWHDDILNLLWTMPDGGWPVYLWHLTSWLLFLILTAVSMVLSYLIAQLFFCVFIMDYMSRITERIHSGSEKEAMAHSWVSWFLYLIRQEIPRAVVPVLIALGITVLGLFTPLGPAILVISSLVTGLFLAWDHTDLVYARRMHPLRERVGFFRKNMGFHLGFGLLFLIPWFNILLLSFAPVGATLYILDQEKKQGGTPSVL